MKKIMLLLILEAFSASAAIASPYFRFIGKPGYVKQVYSEAAFDFKGNPPLSLTSIPLIEHNQADGYLLIPHEDWSPLTVGIALGSAQTVVGSPAAGQSVRTAFGFGPAANLTPGMKALALDVLKLFSSNQSLLNVKSMLAPNPSSSGLDVSINVGYKWVITAGGRPESMATFGPMFTW